ncbi:hypothetical protein LV779_08870 [Streptomyces thinghirensis]|nr:hypothetical protein [Streptomyces thinghirensis]
MSTVTHEEAFAHPALFYRSEREYADRTAAVRTGGTGRANPWRWPCPPATWS